MNHNMHYGPSSASPGFYGHHNHYISAQLQYQQQQQQHSQQQAYLGMGHGPPPQDFQPGHPHSYGGHEGPPSPAGPFPDGAFAHQQPGFGHFQQQQDGGSFYSQSQSPGAYLQQQQYVGDDTDLSKMRYAAHMQRFGGFGDEASGEAELRPSQMGGRVRSAAMPGHMLPSPESSEHSPYDYYPVKAKVLKQEALAPVSNSDSRINRPGEQQLHRQQRSDSNSGGTLDEQRGHDRHDHVDHGVDPSLGPSMDSIPDLPEIPELKFGGCVGDDHDGGGGVKDVGDSVKDEDVDRMAAMQQQRQEEYLPAQGMHGMHQFPMQMGYPGGQMWNYNYMYGQQSAAASGGGIGGGDGFSQGLSNPSMEGLMAAAAAAAAGGPVWWGGSGGTSGSTPPGQSPSPLQRVPSPGEGGFRVPGGLQAPGPWALRAPRPRSDRRGPGRPRLSGAKATGASARMSPPGGMEPFPFSGPLHSDMVPEMLPASPPAPTGGRKRGPGRPRAGLPLSSPGMLDPTTGVISGMIVPEGKAGKGGAQNAANAANKKRYTCEVCQKRFSTAWYVRVHRKSHNGERPYICHNCGKGFMLPNVLQVHLRKCEKSQHAAGGGGLPPVGVGGGNSVVQAGPPSAVRPEMDPDLDDPSPPMPSPSAPSSLHSHASPMGMVPQPYLEHHSSGMLPQSHYGGMGGFSQRYHEHQADLGGANSQYHAMSDFTDRPVHGGYGIPPNPHHLQHRLPTPAHLNESSMSPSGGHLGSTAGVSASPPGHYAQPMFSPGGGCDDSSLPGAPPAAFQQQAGPAHFLGHDRPRDKGGGSSSVPSAASAPSSPEGSCTSPTPPPAEDTNPRHNRPHTCEVCEKRFSQKCNLITHMRLHTGERPYACSFCDKRFTQKGNLDAHLKTHTKEKPYRCPQCDKRFAFKSSMVSHFKQSHGSGERSPAMSPEPFRTGGGAAGGLAGAVPGGPGPYEFEEDEITSIKHQLRYSTSLSQPRSPEAFSTGIPTPQSSTDSVLGCGVGANGQPTARTHMYGASALSLQHPADPDSMSAHMSPHHAHARLSSPAATLH